MRSRPRSAADLCVHVCLSDDARALLDDTLSPQAYFERLTSAGLSAAALRFLPHALSKRAAVWWGALCVWHGSSGELPASQGAALGAALRWVVDPGEGLRRAAEAAGRAAGMQTAAGCLGMAAFWSEGSVAPIGAPAVAPRPHLTARAVGAAVLSAAVIREPHRFRARYLDFLELGRQVACGRNRWCWPHAASAPVTPERPTVEATA